MPYLKSGLRELGGTLLGEGLPYTISLILLVTLLCFALAYHIASPIHSIQSTARKSHRELSRRGCLLWCPGALTNWQLWQKTLTRRWASGLADSDAKEPSEFGIT
jgi:hypothetical protein